MQSKLIFNLLRLATLTFSFCALVPLSLALENSCESVNFDADGNIENVWLAKALGRQKVKRNECAGGEDTLTKVVCDFHATIGEKFAKETARLLQHETASGKVQNFLLRVGLLPAPFNPEGRCKLAQKEFANVDLGAFSRVILGELQQFQCALTQLWGQDSSPGGGNLQSALQKLKAENFRLQNEIETAGKSVALALGIFTRMQLNLVLHMHLECTTEKVLALKEKMQDLAWQVPRLARKFIGAGFE